MPLTIVGIFTFTEEKYKTTMVDALKPLCKYVQENEPKTTNYSFYPDSEDPLVMMAVEEWVDEEALGIHTSSEPFKTFLEVYLPMVEAKQVTVTQKTSKSDTLLVGFGPRSS